MTAFELGRIVGNAAAIAAIFGMFFAGGGAISGAFMGGAMALTLGAAGAATVEIAAGATVVAAKGNSIAEALNSLISEMTGASNSGGKGTEEEGESETENPRDYLDEALERQGLEKTPKRLKEKWTDGEYNYEVRVHEGNSKYTDADSIYRVSRQKVPDPNPKVQGSGKEYLGSDGKWYHESELIEFNKNGTPNPLYNEHGAEVTHIPVD